MSVVNITTCDKQVAVVFADKFLDDMLQLKEGFAQIGLKVILEMSGTTHSVREINIRQIDYQSIIEINVGQDGADINVNLSPHRLTNASFSD